MNTDKLLDELEKHTAAMHRLTFRMLICAGGIGILLGILIGAVLFATA